MTDAYHLSDLLLPELEQELDKTRKLLNNVPEGQNAYKPHEKSFALARLAGHTAELPAFTTLILTTPNLDLATAGMEPLHFETKPQILAAFNEFADGLITSLKSTTDDAFHQPWKLTFKGHCIFDGTRYAAYRSFGVNHLIHHRAQLGVYLRLLNQPVPGTFGPSADEPLGA